VTRQAQLDKQTNDLKKMKQKVEEEEQAKKDAEDVKNKTDKLLRETNEKVAGMEELLKKAKADLEKEAGEHAALKKKMKDFFSN